MKHINCIPTFVHIGVPYMHAFYISLATLVVGLVIGWYVKGRGWFGVKVDAQNTVNDVKTAVAAI